MESLNQSLFLLINATPASAIWLKMLAYFLAKYAIAVVPVLIVALWLWTPLSTSSTQRYAVLKTFTALVYAALLSWIIGFIFPHPRPFAIGLGYQLLSHAQDSSYPSDHGTIIFTFALGFLCWHRFWSGLILFFTGIGIAWSRIYLGVHWPLDMLGSFFVGVSACLIAQIGWRHYGQNLLNIMQTLYRCFLAVPIKKGWVKN